MISQFIQKYLADEGILTFGNDLFVGHLPDMPNNCISLFDEAGSAEDYMQAYASDSIGLQILGRGNYLWLSDKMWEIHRAILGLTEQAFSKYHVKVIQVQSVPQHLGLDPKGRNEMTSHYDVVINQYIQGHRFGMSNALTGDGELLTGDGEVLYA